MSVLTKGTQIYYRDPVGPTVTELVCPTAITGVQASRDQIEDTCLSSEARTYKPGLPTPGTGQITLNFDPSEPSHIRLHELYRSGTTVEWGLGWADGTAPPTLGTADDLDFPTTRTWLFWEGFVSDCPFDFSLNSIVSSTVSVQLSGFPQLQAKV